MIHTAGLHHKLLDFPTQHSSNRAFCSIKRIPLHFTLVQCNLKLLTGCCTALWCTVLSCTTHHCKVPHCAVLHCKLLHRKVLVCAVLHFTAKYCKLFIALAEHSIVVHYTTPPHVLTASSKFHWAYNVKLSSTNFPHRIQWNFKISYPCVRFIY